MEADANTGASAEQAQSEWLSLDWQSQVKAWGCPAFFG